VGLNGPCPGTVVGVVAAEPDDPVPEPDAEDPLEPAGGAVVDGMLNGDP